MDFNSFANKLSNQFEMGMQMAKESLGQSTDATKLPEDFIALEKQVDQLQNVIVQYTKQIRAEIKANYSAAQAPNSPMGNIMKNINTIKADLIPTADLSTVLSDSVALFSPHEPFGAALGQCQNHHLQTTTHWSTFADQAEQQVLGPLDTFVQTTLSMVVKARQQVVQSRLHLDACKSRFRSAKPATVDLCRQELETAEDSFVKAVEDCTVLMKGALEHPETLRCFSEYFHLKKDLLTNLMASLDKIVPQVPHTHIDG